MYATMFLLNIFMLVVLLILIYALPKRFIQFETLSRFRRIAHTFSSPKISILTVFILSFTLAAVISSYKKPLPRIHDEFSYLLASDTFSQGRLTNPTHPFWKHFETVHIFHQPTYASKYPPGQGLFLAAGQIVTGYPIAGVWLSIALACAAICWMLHAWVPPPWALLGGIMAALHPQIVFWGQNYWGGAVALLGGALLFGALRRIIKQPQVGTALVFATGLFFLAISRPLEGFLTAVSATILLMNWMVRQKQFPGIVLFRSVLLPLSFASCLIVASLAFYNYNVTGGITRFPYQVHEEQYSPTPLFLWGSPRTNLKPYNPHLQNVHFGWSLDNYKIQQTPKGYVKTFIKKVLLLYIHIFVFPLGILLLMLPWIVRDRWGRPAVIIVILISFFDIFSATFFMAHYLAPIVPLIFYVLIQGLRHLRASRWNDRRRGPLFVAGLCLLFIIASTIKIALYTWNPNSPERYHLALQRSKTIEKLNQIPKKDLIFVKYSPMHNPHVEWVFNRADIDSAEVVWAHDLGIKENEKLIKYFAERKVWLMDASTDPIKLGPMKKQTQKNEDR